MLRRVVGEDIELTAVLGASLARVRADPGAIEQMIMNLVINARDAMPDRWQADTGDRRGRAGRRIRSPASRRAIRPPRHDVSKRHRYRNDRRDRRAYLRAVLHDQGAWKGHWARPVHGLRHHSTERWKCLGLQRARRGFDVQDLPSARGRAGGRSPVRKRSDERTRIGDHPPRGRRGPGPPRRAGNPQAARLHRNRGEESRRGAAPKRRPRRQDRSAPDRRRDASDGRTRARKSGLPAQRQR